VHIHPVDNESFIESMITCTGILCGAGFETPAEAMFLKKKLMVVPMKGQYEQQCNAAALQKMGVPVIRSLKLKHLEKIKSWVKFSRNLSAEYPDITGQIIDDLIDKYDLPDHREPEIIPGNTPYSLKKFRQLNLGKIINQISRS
jgi:hypothetical protein